MSKISKIRIELDDNIGLYGTMTDQEVADELNIVDKSQNRTSMSRSEIYENIEPSVLGGLTTLQVAQLNLAMSDSVDPFGNAAQVFTNVFGSGSATIIALAAARVETVSQATKLNIRFVHLINVINARSL